MERAEETQRIIEAEERRHLRDRFAAAALTGLLAADAQGGWDDVARDAYALADAMLAQREKGE